MPTWWSRLTSSPKYLAAAGGAAGVVLIAVVVTIIATGADADDPEGPQTTTPTSTPSADSTTAVPEPTLDPTAHPPDKDEYCPAFDKIKAGGFETQADENADGQVDLDELGRKFDELTQKYTAAEKVSPASLRDDYARALGFLREGKKAVESRDIELLKALVSNLDTLNESMETIETKSDPFCD